MLGRPHVPGRASIDADDLAFHLVKRRRALGRDCQRLVAVIVRLGEGDGLETFVSDRDRRRGDVDPARLYGREEAIERDVDDLDLGAKPFCNGIHQIDLEADELARIVLELPRHVADVRADRERLLSRGGQHRPPENR